MKDLPLRKMRLARGMSDADFASEMTAEMGRTVTSAYVRLIEHRGTRVYDYIRAAANVLNSPIDEVATAARPGGATTGTAAA